MTRESHLGPAESLGFETKPLARKFAPHVKRRTGYTQGGNTSNLLTPIPWLNFSLSYTAGAGIRKSSL